MYKLDCTFVLSSQPMAVVRVTVSWQYEMYTLPKITHIVSSG